MSSPFILPPALCVLILGFGPACSVSTDVEQAEDDAEESTRADQETTGAGGAVDGAESTPPRSPTTLDVEMPDEPMPVEVVEPPEEEGCISSMSPLLELGEGIGASFRAFEPGDTLQVDFASQAGIYAHVTLDLDGVSLEEVSGIQSALLVDESPVAEGESTGSSVRCTGSTARFEMIMPVNVHTHPTLPSLVELDGASGRVTATVELSDGSTVQAGTDVMINL